MALKLLRRAKLANNQMKPRINMKLTQRGIRLCGTARVNKPESGDYVFILIPKRLFIHADLILSKRPPIVSPKVEKSALTFNHIMPNPGLCRVRLPPINHR